MSILCSFGSFLNFQTEYDVRSDVDSLNNLANIKKEGLLCIDVYPNGRVSPPYEEGSISSTVWRTGRKLIGISKNSGNISNITKLFDRIYLAYYLFNKDYSSSLQEAMAGLKLLKNKYRHITDRKETVKQLNKISKQGSLILKLMMESKKESSSIEKLEEKRNEKVTRIVYKKSEKEEEDNGEDIHKTIMRVVCQIKKIEAFTHIHANSEILQKCIQSLKHGIQIVHAAGLEIHSKYYKGLNELIGSDLLLKEGQTRLSATITSLFKKFNDIDIVFPIDLTYATRSQQDHDQGRQAALIGLRKTSEEQFFVSVYNRLEGLKTPVKYGPYTEKGICDLICKAMKLRDKPSFHKDAAWRMFSEIFESSLLMCSGRPDYQMQTSDNSLTDGIHEWLLNLLEPRREMSLLKQLLAFGQIRERVKMSVGEGGECEEDIGEWEQLPSSGEHKEINS